MLAASEHAFKEKANKIIDPSTPQNHLLFDILMWDTLYLHDCAQQDQACSHKFQ